MSAFTSTLKSFCEELRLTFPELEAQIARATTTTSVQFWKTWSTGLTLLMLCDAAALFSDRKGFLIGAVRLTPDVWSELSEATQKAIWKYLRTLTLEAAMEVSLESLDTETMQKLMDILMAERVEADPAAATSELLEESANHMTPLLEKLKGLMGSTGFIDLSGLAGFSMPDIPEHLRNGRIAKLAEEMAKQFDPREFGIDPALLRGDNVEEILKRLMDLYQRDPTLMIGGAKRMAERIKKQILGGSLNREELISEAKEFIALFHDHPMFKDVMGKVSGLEGLTSMFGSSGSDSGGAPSDRRRAVQERLRKKMAARGSK